MALAMGLMKEMSGVLGNIVVVHRGKKVFLKRRPERSKKPPTELALEKRAKFGLGGKIAGKISLLEGNKAILESESEKNQSRINPFVYGNHGQFDVENFSGKIILS